MPFDPTKPAAPVRGLGHATGISNNEGWLDKIANALVGDEGRGQSLFGKAMTGLDQLTYGHSNDPADPSLRGTVTKPDTIMGDPTGMTFGMMPFGPKGLRGAAAIAQDIGENGSLFNKGIKIVDQAHMKQNFPASQSHLDQLPDRNQLINQPLPSPRPNAAVKPFGIPDEAIPTLKDETMNRFAGQSRDGALEQLLKLNGVRK